MRIRYLDTDPDHFFVTCGPKLSLTLPAVPEMLYALEQEVLEQDLAENGTTLSISPQLLETPMGMEAFKHCVYLNTLYYSYPNISTKAPPRAGKVKPEDYEHHLSTMKNLPHFGGLNHVACLAKAAVGSPALIIQPGPSFDPAFIAEYRNRCVLIAVARTLPRLLEHDIVPDIIYQQDTSRHSWDVAFDCIRGQHIDSCLVANPAGHIYSVAGCLSRIYKSWNFFPFENDRFPDVIDSIPPSSTSGALALALFLGCNPIVSHGGDCGSLAPAERAHPDGTVVGPPVELTDKLALFPPTPRLVPCIFLRRPGRPDIWTSSDYLASSQWYKLKALNSMKVDPDLRFYDHSLTGLLCESSVIEPFTPQALEGKTRRLELRGYKAPFSWTDFAQEVLRRYKGIRRILSKSLRTPEISLINPYNSLYTGMEQFGSGTFDLTEEQHDLALARADEVIAVMESLLAGDKPS